MARGPCSRVLRPLFICPSHQRAVFHAKERIRPEMAARGLANLVRGDPGDPFRPVLRLVKAQAQALQLQQAFGALIDGLEIEDVGAGKVAAGAVDLVVAECAIVHRLDLTGDRRDHAVCLFGHGSGVDAKKTRHQVGRVSHAAADAVNQSQLITNDAAEPVGETRAGTKDVVENHQGLEIGMMAGNSQMAKHQVDLLSGAVDPAQPRLCRLGHDWGKGSAAHSRRARNRIGC